MSRTSPSDPNEGGLFRRRKLILSCSAEGKKERIFACIGRIKIIDLIAIHLAL
jgi:hypothetical protein